MGILALINVWVFSLNSVDEDFVNPKNKCGKEFVDTISYLTVCNFPGYRKVIIHFKKVPRPRQPNFIIFKRCMGLKNEPLPHPTPECVELFLKWDWYENELGFQIQFIRKFIK